jgi:photosystem II stability/assembly factor-like uncharacterized protein
MSELLVLVGTEKGAFTARYEKSSARWRTSGPHLPGWEVSALTLAGNGTPRLLAGTTHYVYGATIRSSDDLGETWEEQPGSPAYDSDRGFKMNRIWTIERTASGSLFAGVDEAGIFRSDDGGRTWAELRALTDHPTRAQWSPGNGGLCLHTIVHDPADERRMWVAISAVGVFRTDDGGETWELKTRGIPPVPTGGDGVGIDRCVHRIALDPGDNRTLYMQFHGGVFRSTDAADSWHSIEAGLPSNFGFPLVTGRPRELFVAPLDSDERRYMPGGRLRVFRSRDGGEHWQDVSRGLPGDPQYVNVLRGAMARDPGNVGGVLFGTTMGQVYATHDSGDSWQELPLQLPRVLSVTAHRLGA